MRRVVLVRHAPTAATRGGAFPADEELDDAGRAAAALAPIAGDPVVSPALRCRQTAAAMGFVRVEVDPRLAECDFGSWAGRTLAEINPDHARAWMEDPAAAPHGGESLVELRIRTTDWLADEPNRGNGTTIAITHGGVIKAAVVAALGAPDQAVWQIDVAPLSLTELTYGGRRWQVAYVNRASPK